MLAVTLLGPVAAAVRDRPVRLTGRLGRTALAALALHDGRAVAVDALVDALWGDTPPATAREQVHNQISRLRRGGLGSAVVTLTDAYRLDGAAVDVATVQRLREQARSVGEPAAAAGLLRRACDLWRGEPLGGVGPHLAAVERPGLTALRQSVVEERSTPSWPPGRTPSCCPSWRPRSGRTRTASHCAGSGCSRSPAPAGPPRRCVRTRTRGHCCGPSSASSRRSRAVRRGGSSGWRRSRRSDPGGAAPVSGLAGAGRGRAGRARRRRRGQPEQPGLPAARLRPGTGDRGPGAPAPATGRPGAPHRPPADR